MKPRSIEFELSNDFLAFDVTYNADGEAVLPEDFVEKVKAHALQFVIPKWIKEIESQKSDLEFDGVVDRWIREDEKAADEFVAGERFDNIQFNKEAW